MYYSENTNKIYTKRTLENAGLTATSTGVFALYVPKPIIKPTQTIKQLQTVKKEGNCYVYDIAIIPNTVDGAIAELIKIEESKSANVSLEINGVIYNGGMESASAISGAVTLATNLSETTVKLWDINNVVKDPMSFEDALSISAQIAKSYRDIQTSKYEKITEIKACTTIEELEVLENIT